MPPPMKNEGMAKVPLFGYPFFSDQKNGAEPFLPENSGGLRWVSLVTCDVSSMVWTATWQHVRAKEPKGFQGLPWALVLMFPILG